MSQFEPRDLRSAFGTFATGVTIVTSSHDGEDAGLTVNSFSSVSLDPPLILWSLDRKSKSLELFEQAQGFAVHVLAAGQETLSNRFAGATEDRFADLPVERGVNGVPLLKHCASCFECSKAYAYDGGDHVIFVGKVERYEHTAKPPLLFHSGKYKHARAETSATQSQVSFVTNIARLNLFIRQQGMKTALERGLSWQDITVLGVVVRSNPISASELSERVAAAGLLLDRSTCERLSSQKLIVQTDDVFSATPEGEALATEIAAATRARELEIQLRSGQASAQLAEIMASLAGAFGVDADRADPLMEMGDLGQ